MLSKRRERFFQHLLKVREVSNEGLVAMLRDHSHRMPLLEKAAVIRILTLRHYGYAYGYFEARRELRKKLKEMGISC